jgi:hypothetical protein
MLVTNKVGNTNSCKSLINQAKFLVVVSCVLFFFLYMTIANKSLFMKELKLLEQFHFAQTKFHIYTNIKRPGKSFFD